MHPSSQVNFERMNQVKRISVLILAALALYTTVVLEGKLPQFYILAYAFIIGAMAGSWIYFLGTGKVWEEWFWKKRLK